MPRKLDWIIETIIPSFVGDGEIGRVAMARRVAGRDVGIDPVGPDRAGALPRIILGDQPFDRHVREMRDRRRSGRDPHRRDAWPPPGRWIDSGDWKPAPRMSNVSIMLSICRVAMPCVFAPSAWTVDAAIVGRERLDPFAVVRGEILAASASRRCGGNRRRSCARSRPRNKASRPPCGDHPIGAGEIRIAEERRRRPAHVPPGAQVCMALSISSMPRAGAAEGCEIACGYSWR